MICDTCGCTNVRQRELEGFLVAECQVCGQLHGDPDALAKIEEVREGESQGYDRRIYPLVKSLGMISGFRVKAASAGMRTEGTPPYVHFKIHGPRAKVWLEKLMTSLIMANRELKLRWMVEVTLFDGLTFTLQPAFDCPPHLVDGRDITRAREEIDVLSNRIRRDMNLSWWHEVEVES